MRSLFSSGSQYQKYARQHNYNLVESNGCWLLYYDEKLVTSEANAWDAIQFINQRLMEQKQNPNKTYEL
jgi:hypothetical protein